MHYDAPAFAAIQSPPDETTLTYFAKRRLKLLFLSNCCSRRAGLALEDRVDDVRQHSRSQEIRDSRSASVVIRLPNPADRRYISRESLGLARMAYRPFMFQSNAPGKQSFEFRGIMDCWPLHKGMDAVIDISCQASPGSRSLLSLKIGTSEAAGQLPEARHPALRTGVPSESLDGHETLKTGSPRHHQLPFSCLCAQYSPRHSICSGVFNGIPTVSLMLMSNSGHLRSLPKTAGLVTCELRTVVVPDERVIYMSLCYDAYSWGAMSATTIVERRGRR